MTACSLRTLLPLLTTSVVLMWNVEFRADAGTANNQLIHILERFNAPAPPPYRAFRRLEAGDPGKGKHGWMEVWTQYDPGAGFSFDVVREGGSEYVRNNVLRGVLRGEQELIADGKPLRAQFVAQNYSFEHGGVTDSGLMRVLLHPARKSHGIVSGSALVEPESGGLVRIEGRLVKSPSFWVRDVDVTWKFAQIGSAVVPVELSSSARVRFYGRSSFKMTYDYVSVSGRRVGGPWQTARRD